MKKYLFLILLISVFIISGCSSNTKDKSSQNPDFSFVVIGTSEDEIIKQAGKPTYETSDKEVIITDLNSLIKQSQSNMDNLSESAEIKDKIEGLEYILNNDIYSKELKKVIYTVEQIDNDGYKSSYQHSIYYLDGKVIA